MFDFLEDAGRIVLILTLSYFAIRWFARRGHPNAPMATHRLLILLLLAATLVLAKVCEDAIGGESRTFDRQALLWLHALTSPALVTLCYGLTFTGSWKSLAVSGLIALGIFAMLRRKWEAIFLGLSMLAAWLLTWALKTAVGRERPALWETDQYWGASFPSGHTLNTTCFATALVVCISRVWPRATRIAAAIAAVWACLVGLSRLVLGVHWPTDVMAAACFGFIVPFAVQFCLRLARH